MPKIRRYKKGEPHRDARLFVIACEGAKREKQYFENLASGSQRLKIKIVAPNNEDQDDHVGKSSPKWIIDRLIRYIESVGVNIGKGDVVWIVLDIDKWKINWYELSSECKKEKWKLALSNPCFEVWLYMHFSEISKSKSQSCREFKSELGTLLGGKKELDLLSPSIEDALFRSNSIIDDHNNPVPSANTTRVHLLVQELLKMF